MSNALHPRQYRWLLRLLALAVAGACSGDRSPTGTTPAVPTPADPRTLAAYFPPADAAAWDTIAPARLGYDTAALTAALTWAGTQRHQWRIGTAGAPFAR